MIESGYSTTQCFHFGEHAMDALKAQEKTFQKWQKRGKRKRKGLPSLTLQHLIFFNNPCIMLATKPVT